MKTSIEEYLKNNHREMDLEQPEEDIIWEGIRANLIEKKTSSKFPFWKVAAIFLALFTFSYIIYNELGKEKETEVTLAHIDKLLGERELEYQQIVMDKMKAANIPGQSTQSEHKIIIELLDELTELDLNYKEAMDDLAQHGYLEQIVDIIFDTYEKRIRILENIIRESQKIESYEKIEERTRL